MKKPLLCSSCMPLFSHGILLARCSSCTELPTVSVTDLVSVSCEGCSVGSSAVSCNRRAIADILALSISLPSFARRGQPKETGVCLLISFISVASSKDTLSSNSMSLLRRHGRILVDRSQSYYGRRAVAEEFLSKLVLFADGASLWPWSKASRVM
jgi:hypothetical protein